MVDIDGLELSPALRELVGKVQRDDPYIAGVRVGQYAPRVVRLVVDLKQPVGRSSSRWQPVAAYQHRLVFDLYPTQAADPLLALIRDKEAADKRAAQSIQDALGEFIARVDKPVLPGTPPRRHGHGARARGTAATLPQQTPTRRREPPQRRPRRPNNGASTA